MSLELAPGVFAADVRGDLVFLDASRNEYLCVSRSDLTSQQEQPGARNEPLLDELIAAGLVLPSTVFPLETPCACRLPLTATGDLGELRRPDKLPPAHVVLFGIAAVRMAVQLLLGKPLQWLKPSKKTNRVQQKQEDPQRTIELARVVHRLRPWIPRSGRCLPSSILLLEFLRLNGIAADWIFAVRTHPFEAHCWIEKDGIVLNDTLEHVQWFTIIARA
jgi:hypothetical protein